MAQSKASKGPPQKFRIVGGPSKWDLVLQVFDPSQNRLAIFKLVYGNLMVGVQALIFMVERVGMTPWDEEDGHLDFRFRAMLVQYDLFDPKYPSFDVLPGLEAVPQNQPVVEGVYSTKTRMGDCWIVKGEDADDNK